MSSVPSEQVQTEQVQNEQVQTEQASKLVDDGDEVFSVDLTIDAQSVRISTNWSNFYKAYVRLYQNKTTKAQDTLYGHFLAISFHRAQEDILKTTGSSTPRDFLERVCFHSEDLARLYQKKAERAPAPVKASKKKPSSSSPATPAPSSSPATPSSTGDSMEVDSSPSSTATTTTATGKRPTDNSSPLKIARSPVVRSNRKKQAIQQDDDITGEIEPDTRRKIQEVLEQLAQQWLSEQQLDPERPLLTVSEIQSMNQEQIQARIQESARKSTAHVNRYTNKARYDLMLIVNIIRQDTGFSLGQIIKKYGLLSANGRNYLSANLLSQWNGVYAVLNAYPRLFECNIPWVYLFRNKVAIASTIQRDERLKRFYLGIVERLESSPPPPANTPGIFPLRPYSFSHRPGSPENRPPIVVSTPTSSAVRVYETDTPTPEKQAPPSPAPSNVSLGLASLFGDFEVRDGEEAGDLDFTDDEEGADKGQPDGEVAPKSE